MSKQAKKTKTPSEKPPRAKTPSVNPERTPSVAKAEPMVVEQSVVVEAAKFELGAEPEPFEGAELPWAYGDNRVTAMARDPDSLYLYWEISDEAIADARRRLGAAGEWAWMNLRLYDTTGRDFDGTNANSYFDIRIERDDRDRFVMLYKPGTSLHAEIGTKSHEGYFQPIARSGRADFPRNTPSPNDSLHWMTVGTGQSHPSARPYVSRYTGPLGTFEARPPMHHAPPSHGGGHEEVRTWTWQHPSEVEVHWEGPWLFDEWHAEWKMHWLGDSPPLKDLEWVFAQVSQLRHFVDPDRIRIQFVGNPRFFFEDKLSGLESFGPWEIKIRGFGGEGHASLGTWRVHWVSVSRPHVQRWWTAFERRRIGAYRREYRIGAGSESQTIVEAGASELWRAMGSERMWISGSEWLAMGGSERMWMGASEAWRASGSGMGLGSGSGFDFSSFDEGLKK